MRVAKVREAEQAFEELWSRRSGDQALVEVARKAASRGKLEELEVCLVRLADLRWQGLRALETDLRALCAAVRSHPSYGLRRAG